MMSEAQKLGNRKLHTLCAKGVIEEVIRIVIEGKWITKMKFVHVLLCSPPSSPI